MTITKENEYTWYKAALGGQNPPVQDGVVQSGRFRMKQKEGTPIGVAIWRDWENGGMLMAAYDLKTYTCDKDATPRTLPDGQAVPTNYQRLVLKWPYLAKTPIAPGLYDLFFDSGCTKWPDESQAGAETRNAAQAEKREQPAAVTFQHPANTFDGLKERLDKYKPQAEALIKAGAAADGVTADIAADLKNVFLGLETTADKVRAAEKKPHWDAGVAVDAMFKPIIDGARAIKTKLNAIVITPYQQAEQAKVNAEHTAKIQEAQANNVPIPAEQAAPPRVSSGTIGRKVTPRSICNAKITDARSFLAFLAGNQEIHPSIMEAMQKIADAGGSTDATKCATYPGVVYEQTTLSQ